MRFMIALRWRLGGFSMRGGHMEEIIAMVYMKFTYPIELQELPFVSSPGIVLPSSWLRHVNGVRAQNPKLPSSAFL